MSSKTVTEWHQMICDLIDSPHAAAIPGLLVAMSLDNHSAEADVIRQTIRTAHEGTR